MRSPFYSHIHVDVAAEGSPVRDGEAVRLDVSDQGPTGLNVHSRRGVHVARQLTCDADGQRRDVGFDDAVAADRDGLARGERAPDGPVDLDGFVARELA